MVVLCGRLDVVVVEARGLPNLDKNVFNPNDKSDPYCVVEIKGTAGVHRVGKTFTIDDCLNPKWFYKLGADIRQDVSGLIFTVKDKDTLSSEILGEAFVNVKDFISGISFEGCLSLQSPKGFSAGELFVSVRYSGSQTATVEYTLQDRVSLKASEIQRNVSRAIWKHGPPGISFSQSEMTAFLHGALDITIEKAKNLPNLDSSFLSLNKKDVSDPFVVVNLHDAEGGTWKVATTSVIDNNLNPTWDEKFRIEVCHHVTSITFSVRDKDFVSSEVMGVLNFSAESIIAGGGIGGTFDLFKEKNNKKVGQLSLSIRYTCKMDVSDSPEVPECIFPLRPFNKVALYQDAHCPWLPAQVLTSNGEVHQPRSTWRDIYSTIMNAQKFIYIVGWSVSTKISLLRWQGEDTTPLGHLLLAKANEGVRVRLLLWDELTSNDLKKSGAMSTEDEETLDFFKGTSVVVKLTARDRYSKDMLFSTKNSFTKMCYTHHQKCVIADSPSDESPGLRHVLAFVGGLDLTGGRFDTPEHPLFRTLVAEHKDDFRNRMHPTTSDSGPREPWHDIHSCVKGPTAIDVLKNFQERWDKQGAKEDNFCCLQSDPSLRFDYQYKMPDNWSVQMFRSINSDSAVFDWQTIGSCLNSKKGRMFDNSLHRAYIHQIRRAKKFIYIENQYFMGSSHVWLDCRDSKAGNLIPLEIATRIEEKIRAGERFAVYILTPMFPEGKPSDKVTQEILHWQFRTMQMMYYRIAKTLRETGSDAHPQDYLLFLCLANKEGHESVPSELVVPEDVSAAAAFNHRRLMIYVHSKMAIFDDEYVIVGSANINDRSMSGNRDTEIAVGSFQPAFVTNGNQLPSGDVSLFRKSLWSEHLGTMAPLYEDPSSVGCVRRVRQLADEALACYIDESVAPIPRHMIMYPLNVEADGVLSKRDDCPFIPDTQASFVGARSKVFPSSLTT